MPGMDGITAAEIIGEERIAPILMLTAFSERELVERARDAGVMGYLVKPFGANEVVPAIEVAIGRFADVSHRAGCNTVGEEGLRSGGVCTEEGERRDAIDLESTEYEAR